MEEEKKVINIKKNSAFYLFRARKFCEEEQDFKKALKYLRMAEQTELNEESKSLVDSIRSGAYCGLRMIPMGIFYGYKVLKRTDGPLADSVYPMLARAYFMLEEYDVARFYANVYLNQHKNSPQAQYFKEMFAEIDRIQKEKPALQLVNDEYLLKHNLFLAHESMSQGNLEEAIKTYENMANFQNDDIRNELVMAYFFAGELDRASEIINDYGKDSVQDLISQMLIEYSLGHSEKCEKIKKRLLNIENVDMEQKYRIGASFSQVGEDELAVEYMRGYVESGIAEPELDFLYCITCINCGRGDQIKSRLLDLKLLDPFDGYIFDYYLKFCGSNKKHNFKYIFNIPRREENLINAKVKEMLVQTPEELLKEFKENEDLFYYIAKQDTNITSLLLLKLASIDDGCLDDFFDFILLGRQTKTRLKNRIALKRAGLNCTRRVCLVRDDIFSKIILPNNLATKTNNLNLYKAVMLLVEYIFIDIANFQLTIAKPVVRLERKIKGDNVDEKVLAAYLAWDILKDARHAPLNKICKQFKITQEDFYAFTKKYNLEV